MGGEGVDCFTLANAAGRRRQRRLVGADTDTDANADAAAGKVTPIIACLGTPAGSIPGLNPSLPVEGVRSKTRRKCMAIVSTLEGLRFLIQLGMTLLSQYLSLPLCSTPCTHQVMFSSTLDLQGTASQAHVLEHVDRAVSVAQALTALSDLFGLSLGLRDLRTQSEQLSR